MRLRRGLPALIALLAAAACGSSSTSTTITTTTRTTAPAPPTSSTPTSTQAPSTGKRIVVVYMENKNYSTIMSSGCCPYEAALARRGLALTNFYGVAYPSLPNYLAFGGGDTFGRVGSDAPVPLVTAPNLFQQMSAAGVPWRAWAESYPGGAGSCNVAVTSANYALRHVAPLLFQNVADTSLCSHVSSVEPRTLPPFLWVTPNMCNDAHDCPPAVGDRWLAAHVPRWIAQGGEVFITYDTGNPDTTHGGGHVYAVLAGHAIHPRTDAALMNHYSALAGVERAFGLPLLGHAHGATPVPF